MRPLPASKIPTAYIVDDDSSVRTSLARLLRSADIEAHVFAAAEEFLEGDIVTENACVIADLSMPSMSGLDLQSGMKNAGMAIPLIILSANDTPQAREQVPVRPLHWIDRILDQSTDTHITGIKNVTATEDYFNDHFPHKPVLPGVIIIQCMVSLAKHLADRLLAQSSGHERRAVLHRSDKIKFRMFVQPGDQLLMQAKLNQFADDRSLFTAQASVSGKNAASLRLEFDHVSRDEYLQRYYDL